MEMPGLPMSPMMSPMPDAGALGTQAHASSERAKQMAAEGFESLFASLLVKEMRQSLDQDTMFGQDRSEILGGLFDFYMGSHLAQSGRLGIGDMIKHQLSPHKAAG
jgi:Rod binding domain-containing protein